MDSTTPGFNWSRAGGRTPIPNIPEHEEDFSAENMTAHATVDIASIASIRDSSPIMEEIVPEWQVVSDPEDSLDHDDQEFALQMSNRSEPVISSLNESPMNFSGEDDKEPNCDPIKDTTIWGPDGDKDLVGKGDKECQAVKQEAKMKSIITPTSSPNL